MKAIINIEIMDKSTTEQLAAVGVTPLLMENLYKTAFTGIMEGVVNEGASYNLSVQVVDNTAPEEPAPKEKVTRIPPESYDADKEFYFTRRFKCPTCGLPLASYDYGRAHTEDGLSEEKRLDCSECGQAIDWSGVPYPKKTEA